MSRASVPHLGHLYVAADFCVGGAGQGIFAVAAVAGLATVDWAWRASGFCTGVGDGSLPDSRASFGKLPLRAVWSGLNSLLMLVS
jgi:hypothetical protein